VILNRFFHSCTHLTDP